MRLLMIHNRYQAAGGEDASTDAQVELLRSAGHEVTLLEDSNERVEELGSLRTAARSVWSREAKSRVDAVLAKHDFDVMHVQNYFPLFSPSVYYAAWDHGVPVVQSLRNFRAICPEGMLHRDGAVCTDCVGKRAAWPGVVHQCYRDSAAGTAVVAIMSAGHRTAGTWRNRVARYVTPSRYARDVYVAGGWDPGSIEVIPNFVYPDPGPGSGDGGYAVYAGRLAPSKGLDTLLEAWRVGNIELPLKIVGEGPVKHYVRGAARANPHVEYLGEVDADAVTALVGGAMFAVVPTRGIETFGRVAAEAMARGTPAIAAGHGGLAEIVSDGETGLLFPPGDVAALIDRVQSLIASPERLAAMRRAARTAFLKRFSGEQVLDSWLRLYREVGVAGGGRPRAR